MVTKTSRNKLLKNSRYNFHVEVDSSDLLFNCNTGSVISLHGPDSKQAIIELCGPPRNYSSQQFPNQFLNDLLQGGFLVPSSVDELGQIRERFWQARKQTPMVLTVTVTNDCNLACYYCYQSRTTEKLIYEDINNILLHTKDRLLKSNKKSLHVDWYGGEPMENRSFLEKASLDLQKLCAEMKVDYKASIISNGTNWPKDVHTFIENHKIRQVQISFDGLKKNHDKRRRYANKSSESSFLSAVSLVDKLVDCTRVDLRFNMDRKNAVDLDGFIQLAINHGWFSSKFPAVFQPARLSSYSDKSSFMRDYEFSLSEFDSLREKIRYELQGIAKTEESEAPDGYPFPKSSVCAALADSSIVIGADKRLYRCGLQVTEKHRAVSKLPQREESKIKTQEGNKLLEIPVKVSESNDSEFWDDFDPTKQPKCKKCSFLPICWGGCPKKHLEQDIHALDEQSLYWRNNLSRLVANGVEMNITSPQIYTEADQFR